MLLLCGLVIASCASNPLRNETVTRGKSGDKIRNVREYSLTHNATGIVEKDYTGGWTPRSVGPGRGSVIRIYRSSFLIGSFDGLSHSTILIQLPKDIVVGKRYRLAAVSGSRPTRTDGYGNVLGGMQEGEVAAYRFGNPLFGELKKVDAGWLTVLSLNAKTADVHLRLKADLESDLAFEKPIFGFDIDEVYTVGISSKPKR